MTKKSLNQIKLNTLFINPPTKYELTMPIMAIPQLRWYLESIWYTKIKVFDFYKTQISNKINKYTSDHNNSVKFDSLQNDIAGLFDSINNILSESQPNIIWISAVYEDQLVSALIISYTIKKINPKINIYIWWPQITLHVESLIHNDKIKELISWFITNYWEKSIEKIIYNTSKNLDFNDIPNLYYNLQWQFIKNDLKYQPDIQTFSIPNYDEIIKNYPSKTLPIRGSIWCAWWKCSFCSYRYLHSDLKITISEIDNIVETIKVLKEKYNTIHFAFIDDRITPLFIKKFSEKIIKSNINIKWSCMLALVPWFDNDNLISVMARSWCESVGIWLESASPRLLKLMQKPHTPEKAEQIIKLLHKYKININAFIMFWFPTETKEEAITTLKFIIKHKNLLSQVCVNLFWPQKWSDLYEHPEKYWVKNIKEFENGSLDLIYKSWMSQKQAKDFTLTARKILEKYSKLYDNNFILT